MTVRPLALLVAGLAAFGLGAVDSSEDVIVRWRLEGGQVVVVSRHDTGYRRPLPEERRETKRGVAAPSGVRADPPDREHDYRFTLVSADGARRNTVWSWRIQSEDDAPHWSEFELISASLVDPDVLMVVFREGSHAYVHGIDLRRDRQKPLGLPSEAHEVLRLGGRHAVYVHAAEVRGRAFDGSLVVVLTGKRLVDAVNGEEEQEHGVIGRASLERGDAGLEWVSSVEGTEGDTGN